MHLVEGPTPPDGNLGLWSRRLLLTPSTLCSQSGIERGYFSSRPHLQSCVRAEAAQHNTANLDVVLAVAAQIASAMAYLHSRNVVHGDLCGSNVMLTTDKSKPAGFTSKVLPCTVLPPLGTCSSSLL
jgi:serine/threonine protein kinase